uniref:Uncharacterized protein n=1 Tax=Anopheles farauti TaxID=69004 RepID=A0A182QXW8_9DIPT
MVVVVVVVVVVLVMLLVLLETTTLVSLRLAVAAMAVMLSPCVTILTGLAGVRGQDVGDELSSKSSCALCGPGDAFDDDAAGAIRSAVVAAAAAAAAAVPDPDGAAAADGAPGGGAVAAVDGVVVAAGGVANVAAAAAAAAAGVTAGVHRQHRHPAAHPVPCPGADRPHHRARLSVDPAADPAAIAAVHDCLHARHRPLHRPASCAADPTGSAVDADTDAAGTGSGAVAAVVHPHRRDSASGAARDSHPVVGAVVVAPHHPVALAAGIECPVEGVPEPVVTVRTLPGIAGGASNPRASGNAAAAAAAAAEAELYRRDVGQRRATVLGAEGGAGEAGSCSKGGALVKLGTGRLPPYPERPGFDETIIANRHQSSYADEEEEEDDDEEDDEVEDGHEDEGGLCNLQNAFLRL